MIIYQYKTKGISLLKINRVLLDALMDLDDWLIKNNLEVELDIIGGIALHLHNIDILRVSMDIDLANQITDKDVLHQIKEIGRLHGLDETWIEYPDVPVPKDSSFETDPFFSALKKVDVKFLSLKDLIITKIASYYDRMHIQTTDAADIEAVVQSGVNFDEELLQKGIDFIRETRKIDEEKISEVFEDLSQLY
jgi:hypothetical protein